MVYVLVLAIILITLCLVIFFGTVSQIINFLPVAILGVIFLITLFIKSLKSKENQYYEDHINHKGNFMQSKMLLTTQDFFNDFKIEKTLGLVCGNTVRSRDIARNLIAGLKTFLGGEIPEYTKAVAESREQALDRMINHAQELDADAIVAIRFIAAEVDKSCSEIMVYGTAVKLQK